MQRLYKIAKITTNPISDAPVSSVLNTIRRALTYGIEYNLMTRLNYMDLKALIIEYDIDNLEKYIKQMRQMRQDNQGIEVREATQDDIKRMFG